MSQRRRLWMHQMSFYTRDYLNSFEDEAAKATDSAALIAAMKKRYPN